MTGMVRGFQYVEENKLLINHLTKSSIFDEVSYLLMMTVLIEKLHEHKPKYLLIIIKNKKIFNFDIKFKHWLEQNLVPALRDAGVEKIAFVIPFALKNYKVPDFSEKLPFKFKMFERIIFAFDWFELPLVDHLTGFESHSVEIPF